MAGVMSPTVQAFVRRVRLGFVASVNPDGTPSLSPKGTTTVWDGDHLVFADIDSPGTVRNLRANPAIEVNVVDPFTRKGYRFTGTASVLTEGEAHARGLALFARMGVHNPIRSVVLVKVAKLAPLISPGYRVSAVTEEQMRARWLAYYSEPGADPDRNPTDG